MDYTVITDSCCDINPELNERLKLETVPFTMLLGNKEFVDSPDLDVQQFVAEMIESREKAGSAAPSPDYYRNAIEQAARAFVITISSKLSGSYQNAMMGRAMALENGAEDAYVFDSKSASAGELLAAIKLRELMQSGIGRDQIVRTVNRFIDNMKTYFVLEKYDNLLKNGRLNKITGKLISILNIQLIMGADKEGNIALFAKVRGASQIVEKLANMIESSGKKTEGQNLVITHCNNEGLAAKLKKAVEDRFRFKEIFVVPTRGLSSLYTDNKGIVMSF